MSIESKSSPDSCYLNEVKQFQMEEAWNRRVERSENFAHQF